MSKTIFTLLVSLWSSLYLIGQTKTTVPTLFQKAEFALAQDSTTKSLEFCDQAILTLTNNKDTLNAIYPKLLYLKGKAFIAAKENKEAITILQRSIDVLSLFSAAPKEDLLKIYNQIGEAESNLKQYNKAVATIEKGLALSTSKIPENSSTIAESWFFIGKSYRYSGDYKKAEIAFNQSLSILKKSSEPDNLFLADIWNQKGIVTNKLGKSESCILAYENALQFYRKDAKNQQKNIAGTTYNLANVFLRLGAYSKALKQYQKAIDIDRQYNMNYHRLLSNCYVGMGVVFRNWGDYELALEYYQKGLEAKLNNKDDYPPNLATTYMNIGVCYDYLGNYESARLYLEKARAIYQEFFGENHSGYGRVLKSLGILESSQGNFDKALKMLQQSKTIYIQNVGETHSQIAQIEAAIGDTFTKKGASESAISTYNRAVSIIEKKETHYPLSAIWLSKKAALLATNQQEMEALSVLDKADSTIHLNEGIEKTLAEKENFLPLMKALVVRGNIYTQLYKKEQDQMWLEKAAATYQLGITTLIDLRGDYKTENSRQFVLEKHFELFSNALTVFKNLYDETGEVTYAESAFKIVETTKGLIIADALQTAKVKATANIPVALLDREQALKEDLSLYERLRYKAQKKELADSSLIEINDKIFHFKNQLYALQDTLANQYQSLHGNPEIPKLVQVQQELTDETTALIEYFVADNQLFIFTINQQQYFLDKVELPLHFKDTLLSFVRNLATPTKSYSTEMGYFIKENLLEKPLVHLSKTTIKNLVIIPDVWLGYLPFETLPGTRKKNDFLLQQFNISYAYAAHLLLNKEEKNNKRTKPFAGFAPQYQASNELIAQVVRGANGKTLEDLPGAKREITTIAELINGDAFVGKEVTETLFRQKANQYRILHLSMHAELDDKSPLYSRFIFNTAGDTLNDGELFASELFNLPLNADLAVLSACNTGFGEVQRGEGIMSLSRAFRYAGVPATVMSLWKVPDDATSILMTHFYQSLKAGKKKDAALKQAKIAYLDHVVSPEQKHPFYWSGFIAAGDMQAIAIETPSIWKYLGIFSLAIFSILIFVYFRKNI